MLNDVEISADMQVIKLLMTGRCVLFTVWPLNKTCSIHHNDVILWNIATFLKKQNFKIYVDTTFYWPSPVEDLLQLYNITSPQLKDYPYKFWWCLVEQFSRSRPWQIKQFHHTKRILYKGPKMYTNDNFMCHSFYNNFKFQLPGSY